MRDGILLSELLPHTQRGIRAICERLGWEPEAIDWPMLFFVMRELPDEDQLFPSGKLATIQRIEVMLTEWAKARAGGKNDA